MEASRHNRQLEANEPEEPQADGAPERAPSVVWERLPVHGFGDAWVTRPEPSGRALPVLVAAHGAGDNAELICDFWSKLVEQRAFVLCPRGTAMDKRAPENSSHYFKNHHELEREVLASVVALEKRYPGQLRADLLVYTAYSQGATMGALMLPEHGARFARLVLVEGGVTEWTLTTARTYQQRGGERVLFVCGTRSCAERAKSARALLSKAGLSARAEFVPGGGHTYLGPVGEVLEREFSWVIEGVPGWR